MLKKTIAKQQSFKQNISTIPAWIFFLIGWLIIGLALKFFPNAWLKILPPPWPLKFPWLPLALAAPFWLAALCLYVMRSWRHYRRQSLVYKVKRRDALLKLSWQQFEVLVAEFYRLRGFRVVECGGGGPDGGVDLRLYRGRKLILVQCKHWNSRVGVKPVRELYGLMAAEQAQMGILVATSDFSLEAKRFAEGKAMQLVSGDLLLDWLQKP